MLKKDSIITGALIALLCPAIAFAVSYLLQAKGVIINRPAIPYLFAIALNLILLRLIQKRELDKTSRGIMLATFIIMLLIFVLKIHPIR